jgi:hypothetical protein
MGVLQLRMECTSLTHRLTAITDEHEASMGQRELDLAQLKEENSELTAAYNDLNGNALASKHTLFFVQGNMKRTNAKPARS